MLFPPLNDLCENCYDLMCLFPQFIEAISFQMRMTALPNMKDAWSGFTNLVGTYVATRNDF